MVKMPDTRTVLLICMLGLLSVMPNGAMARGISIDRINHDKVNDSYLLNAKVSYTFSNDLLDALEHGVALYFNVILKTSMKRQLLWDKTLAMDTINYRLEYHPLSQRYLLTEYNRLLRYDYTTLDAALTSMGTISNYPIKLDEKLSADGDYITSVRVLLDSKSLPAPLRPLSYISPGWKLSSSWKSMKLMP